LNGTAALMNVTYRSILRVCLLYPVFLSDVLSDVIGVISEYSADSALYPTESNFAYACYIVSVQRQKILYIFMIYPAIISNFV